jgi:hypothetical protein
LTEEHILAGIVLDNINGWNVSSFQQGPKWTLLFSVSLRSVGHVHVPNTTPTILASQLCFLFIPHHLDAYVHSVCKVLRIQTAGALASLLESPFPPLISSPSKVCSGETQLAYKVISEEKDSKCLQNARYMQALC